MLWQSKKTNTALKSPSLQQQLDLNLSYRDKATQYLSKLFHQYFSIEFSLTFLSIFTVDTLEIHFTIQSMLVHVHTQS